MAQAFQNLFALCFLSFLFINGAVARIMLFSGTTLNSGQSLDNGRYRLIMQADCNLVLYNNGRAIWATGTANRGTSCRVTMQSTGNLAVATGAVTNLWNSNSARGPGIYQLILQDDGNLVIYGEAVWASNTTMMDWIHRTSSQ